ncbi:MAG: hypothetical protein PWQ10_598 [Patescibacteria group bacterium]|nr:hypothetical protein [Patescibacteria group bacterium]
MNSAAEVLVIFLSVFLAIFLMLGIILTGYLIGLTKQIREITKSAGRTANSLESIISGIAKVVSPMFAAEMFNKFINSFKKNKGDK